MTKWRCPPPPPNTLKSRSCPLFAEHVKTYEDFKVKPPPPTFKNNIVATFQVQKYKWQLSLISVLWWYSIELGVFFFVSLFYNNLKSLGIKFKSTLYLDITIHSCLMWFIFWLVSGFFSLYIKNVHNILRFFNFITIHAFLI